jgi:hypothetical protein
MEYKIYIIAKDNFPMVDWACSAYLGFKEKGFSPILFEDIREVPVSKSNVVVSFIEDTSFYFERLGVNVPYALNIPESLKGFTKRDIEYMTVAEFMQDKRQPIFVKPASKGKPFSSGVIKEFRSKPFILHDVKPEELCMVSNVIDIVSEYRCYVIKGILKAIKHYLGDIRIFPNMQIIDAAISMYDAAPSCYAIDFGITSAGETVLIECNDAWSLGNYGLENREYANMLLTRWIEIVN